MNRTSISWTHRPQTGGAAGGFTWNPIRAKRIYADADRDLKPGTFCTRISPGCQHCYASTINRRFGNGLEYTVPNLEKVEFYLDERILEEPLKRRKPATIFVGDMFDLFHEAISEELIWHVLETILRSQQHTFQILTKRADRMRNLWLARAIHDSRWPLPNLWPGVSVESQKYADERIPLLLRTPASVRFISYEPALERVKLTRQHAYCPMHDFPSGFCTGNCPGLIMPNWIIMGGESGHAVRPMDISWAESMWEQCKASGVSFYMKQDSGRFPGTQGRIPDEIWNTKEFPA